jgi:hypothetical protein
MKENAMDEKKKYCGDCGEYVTRRDFIRTAAAGAAAAAATTWGAMGSVQAARPLPDTSPEELVKRFYGTLSEKQKGAMCFEWSHKNRTKVSNNWKIVEQEIGAFYTADQQQILRDIFRGLVTPDGYDRFMRAFKDDAGGFEKYTVAVFGDPSTEKYEWVMTGRHLTIRCDGHSQENVAFGGPIFYGHAVQDTEKPNHPGNVWWEQALLANKVYSNLDGKQQAKALLAKSPQDSVASIRIRKEGEFQGIAVAELSKDQKGLVEEVMKDLLKPYRASDVEETMKYIKENGGLEKLHIAFYQEEDLGSDGIWDRWMLQGPNLSWYFRGSPHVHTWVNVVEKA